MHKDIEIITARRNKHSTDTELLDFALSVLSNEVSNKRRSAHKKINDGIEYLILTNDWVSLHQILKHVAEGMLSAANNEKFLHKKDIAIFRFLKEIIHMGKSEFIELLTEDAKEKYFGGNNAKAKN